MILCFYRNLVTLLLIHRAKNAWFSVFIDAILHIFSSGYFYWNLVTQYTCKYCEECLIFRLYTCVFFGENFPRKGNFSWVITTYFSLFVFKYLHLIWCLNPNSALQYVDLDKTKFHYKDKLRIKLVQKKPHT